VAILEYPFDSAALYNPVKHQISDFIVSPSALARAASTLNDILPEARGAFLLGLADFQRATSHYEHAESLVWRDAGCLFATLHLTATALGLGSCLMGLAGTEIAQVLSPDHRVVPVGVLAVGST
jgi:nitroreductase